MKDVAAIVFVGLLVLLLFFLYEKSTEPDHCSELAGMTLVCERGRRAYLRDDDTDACYVATCDHQRFGIAAAPCERICK